MSKIFVGLFRGINVGKNHRIDMTVLKSLLIKAGYSDVMTYINSGNIIFSSPMIDEIKHQSVIELIVLNHFDVKTKVLVMSKAEFNKIHEMIPSHFDNNDVLKSDVIFYYKDITKSLVSTISYNEDVVEVVNLEDALIYCVSRENQSQGGIDKVMGKKVYQYITIRNVNTVRKLSELLK